MYFEKLSNEILLQNISALVKKEREITLEVLHLLQEIERRRLFAELGFSSLFEYAVKALHYSEGAAQRRISGMRLLRSLPELETKVENGVLSLSVLAQAQTFFRQEKLEKNNEVKKEILLELEGKSSREVERELIARSANPEKALLQAKEGLRPLSPHYSQLSIVINAQLLQELEELRALLAARNPHMSFKEVIEFSIGHSLKHLRMKPPKEAKASAQKEATAEKSFKPQKDPADSIPPAEKLFKAQEESLAVNLASSPPAAKASQTSTLTTNASLPPSASDSLQTSTLSTNARSPPPASAVYSSPEPSPTPATNFSPEFSRALTPHSPSKPSSPPPANPNKPNSRYIPIQIKRQIWQRDQNQCTYVHADTSRRCTSTFNLQIDHIQPHARGGANTLDNLRLLCRAHNTYAAVEQFGAQKINSFQAS